LLGSKKPFGKGEDMGVPRKAVPVALTVGMAVGWAAALLLVTRPGLELLALSIINRVVPAITNKTIKPIRYSTDLVFIIFYPHTKAYTFAKYTIYFNSNRF